MQLSKKTLKQSILKKFQNFENKATVSDFIWMFQPEFIGQVFWYIPPSYLKVFQLEIYLFKAFDKKRDVIKFHKLFLYVVTKM